MRKYLLPFVLIVAGICLVILSARSVKKEITLIEVSGSISNHSSSEQNFYSVKPHYFWLRGYQCTFLITRTKSSDLDASVFDRSFQDTSHVFVKIPIKAKPDLQKMDKVIPVHAIRSVSRIYLEESDDSSMRFNPALMFMGICAIHAALIILIFFLVKEVRTY